MITHLEPDILEWEVKWSLGSISMNKDSAGDRIPVELVSSPKRWCCESAALNMPANLENSAVATGLEKVSFHSKPKVKQHQRMLKLLHNCIISHASKPVFDRMWTVNFQIARVQLQQPENQPEGKICVGEEWRSLWLEVHIYFKHQVFFYTLTKALGQRFDIFSSPFPRFIVSLLPFKQSSCFSNSLRIVFTCDYIVTHACIIWAAYHIPRLFLIFLDPACPWYPKLTVS